MTERVSVPKKLLQRFNIQTPLLTRQRRGRNLFIPPRNRHPQKDIQKQRENTTTPPPLPKRQNRMGSRLRWLLLWSSIVSFLGMCVVSGVLLLTKLPPPIDCKSISPLASDGDRLYCAQLAAQPGNLDSLVAAIKLVEHWTAEHALYPEAQRRLKEWSSAILGLANQKIKQGNYLDAIKIAQRISLTSPLYPEAQAAIATWQEQWQKVQETTRQFKNALLKQNWQQASVIVGALSESEQPYWSAPRIQALMQQMAAEKLAWQQLEDARDLAKMNRLPQLEEAIQMVSKINPNSYIKATAQQEQTRWSRTLVQMAAINYKNQDFLGVLKVLQRIPTNTSLYQEAQDWIRLARASQTARNKNILTLLDAIAYVSQIQPDSPIKALALSQATLWESQLRGYTYLQIAQLTASLEQRMALAYAIDYAQKVAPKHPQRLFAQTLIAQWRKETQLIEDRNKLIEAQKLADRGRIEQLKRAVELASTIKPGQILRRDAQSAVAKWTRQIQTIEDQPILELSQTFAQQQDFTAAISTAGRIRPGRALYAEAQRVIALWVAQIQTAQDRPILEAATALAYQGRFDAAIATASQIPPERALYQQAQAAIAEWNLQNEAIRSEVLAPQ